MAVCRFSKGFQTKSREIYQPIERGVCTRSSPKLLTIELVEANRTDSRKIWNIFIPYNKGTGETLRLLTYSVYTFSYS
jgi:hypothetical protein